MERLTRRNNCGWGMPSRHLNVMNMDTTSEDTLTDIIEKLANYEDLEEKAGYELSTAVHELSSEILRLKDKIVELKNDIGR